MKVYTGVQCLYGEYDITPKSNRFTFNDEVEILESKMYDSTSVKRDAGLIVFNGELGGIIDTQDAAHDEIFQSGADTTPAGLQGVKAPISLHLAGYPATEGDLSAFANGIGSQITPMAEQGALHEFSMQFAGDSPRILGTLMATGQKTVTGAGTARQLGAVADGQSVYAVLHVPLAVSGTIDVIVESDDNGGMTTPTTRLTFAQILTTPGYQFLELKPAGGLTDDWWQVSWTSAASPDHTISCSVGIK
jgi:hypothetical protein